MVIVDAANVVGSRPDGWWRDRGGAAGRLVEALQGLDDADYLVVLEGAARRGAPEGSAGNVTVVHATGSGDDAITELAGPGTTVVTADRELRRRVQERGAAVEGPRVLLDRLQPAGSGPGQQA